MRWTGFLFSKNIAYTLTQNKTDYKLCSLLAKFQSTNTGAKTVGLRLTFSLVNGEEIVLLELSKNT